MSEKFAVLSKVFARLLWGQRRINKDSAMSAAWNSAVHFQREPRRRKPHSIPDHRKRRDEQHAHDHVAPGLGTALPCFSVPTHSFVDLLAVAPIF
jgi:hypothetical protein